MRTWAIWIIAAVVIGCSCTAGPARSAAPVADTQSGRVRGALANGVASFKGIPFAAPPVGDLRWRPPQPPARWTGARDATAYGPVCLQRATPTGMQTPVAMSEDCLTLNIWTPASRRGRALPVMVWIHGGAFGGGSGAAPAFDGARLAQRGVVLVTINFRLGRFGTFAHPKLRVEHPEEPHGNYQMMDQIAALRWVQNNISSFGGDPANVTIFGLSSGGWSVNYLVASPAARGLFAKAISESSVARLETAPIAELEVANANWLDGLGVAVTDAASLRALSADVINGPFPPFRKVAELPIPVIDGTLITRSVFDGEWAGDPRVPFMVGGNSWEASVLPPIVEHPEIVLDRLGTSAPVGAALYGADKVIAAREMTTDSAYLEPNRELATMAARRGANAFVYFFSFVSPPQRSKIPGVRHGGEVAYVFGNLPADATAEDRAMSDTVMGYWTAFARTGHPGSVGGVAWPAFVIGSDTTLEFGNDGPAVRSNWRKPRFDFVRKAGLGCLFGVYDAASDACVRKNRDFASGN